MRIFISIIILLNLLGCSLYKATSTITTPNNDVYTVVSGSDAIVEFKKGDIVIVADNRGRPSFLETILSALVLRIPDTIGDGE